MYKHEPVPTKFDAEFLAYLERELDRIGAETSEPQPATGFILPELHVEPERPREGLVVFADGTNWNPGSGKGFYGYHGSSWNFLG